jgi:hypothetical protein
LPTTVKDALKKKEKLLLGSTLKASQKLDNLEDHPDLEQLPADNK